jgi:L-alanine-DL-glutamate epimerase-like enolase superfamily enzyme
MRIVGVEVTAVSVPCHRPVRWRYGATAGVTTALVSIRTDDGIEGIGEAPGVPSIGIVLEAIGYFVPALVGEDPLGVRRLMDRARSRGAAHFPFVSNVVLAAFEMALWDICGKALDAPVHQLFGGITSPSIPFYWHVNSADGTEEEAVRHAQEGLAQGFTTLYMKGSDDARHDLELMLALRREAGPDIALRLDPNEGWTFRDCLKHEGLLREVGLEFLEQPFEMRAHRDARELRHRLGVPVAANQSAWFLPDVHDVLDADAADVVVTGLHQAGGLGNLDAAHAICSIFDVPLVRHSLCDLGVATAAALQVLSTWGPTGMAHQTHLTLVEHDLLAERLTFAGGRLEVPAGPGLGVELDGGAVERYAKRFREEGEYVSYEHHAR